MDECLLKMPWQLWALTSTNVACWQSFNNSQKLIYIFFPKLKFTNFSIGSATMFRIIVIQKWRQQQQQQSLKATNWLFLIYVDIKISNRICKSINEWKDEAKELEMIIVVFFLTIWFEKGINLEFDIFLLFPQIDPSAIWIFYCWPANHKKNYFFLLLSLGHLESEYHEGCNDAVSMFLMISFLLWIRFFSFNCCFPLLVLFVWIKIGFTIHLALAIQDTFHRSDQNDCT